RQQLSWVGWAYNQDWWAQSDTLKDTLIDIDGDTVIVDSFFGRLYNPDSMSFHIPSSDVYAFIDADEDTIDIYEYYSGLFPDMSSEEIDTDSLIWLYYNEFVAQRGYYVEGDKTFSWNSAEDALEGLNERWYEVNEWRAAREISGIDTLATSDTMIIDTSYDTVGIYYHLFDYDRYRKWYTDWRDWDSVIYEIGPAGDTLDSTEVEYPYLDSLEGSGNMYYCRYNRDPQFGRFAYYFPPYWWERNTTKYQADAWLTWFPDTTNKIKIGISGTYNDLVLQSIQFTNENPYSDEYHVNPINFAAYFSDEIDYQDLNIDAGLRFDYFDPAAEHFVDPDSIDLGKEPAKPKLQFSPRLSISFAVGEKSVMYASYGHFFQPVELGELYQNLEGDITTGVPLLGNPNLPPLRTTSYEVGYEQVLDDENSVALSVKAYYRDQENLLATRQVTTIYKRKLAQYTVYQLEDFAKIKGVDIRLTRRPMPLSFFSGSVVYSFMDAKGTGSSGREFYYRYRGSSLEPPKHEYPLEFDIPHSIKANANFYLPPSDSTFWTKLIGDLNLNVMFSAQSGRPYWATDSKGQAVPLGTRRTPPTKSVDVKLEKWFGMGKKKDDTPRKAKVGFFFDVSNVFDWENVSSVYSNTGLPGDPGGDPVYEPALYRDPGQDGYHLSYQEWQDDLADWERYYGQNPGNYMEPRILRFGLRVTF
ncbi:TonB-dependent receptor, partial [candidate division WOR-3 bacterium]|nr:TonB-dependent receptor [candidate division WOR-3 bacterium]MBD3364274.1 TonB-dependent receptor [candidate division WOR-3 bacterium]